MHAIIETNKEKLLILCKKHFVKSLYVFGSVTGNNFNNKSDLDFLYEINTKNFSGWGTGKMDYADNLFALEEGLQTIFERKIDMVPDTIITNKYMKKNIEKSKQLVYAD